ncbi:phosphate transport regulator [Sulfodiicoccus acidiphilus]|uniref:Phosphate transport regulator n=2 Tax=Sulfodiicoccus acidiphilus TaxID=1670455 RepID=A0A348B0T8_9CREN|nr:phosphate transport regulator [Sulfodiicoccus acidiphilus]GGT99213.1 phosphate transport regulator [Sulfodiicoccus acidiphilus]
MNIEEQIQRTANLLLDEVRLFYEMLSKVPDGQQKAMQSYSKIFGVKNAVEESKHRTMEYIVRVGPSLMERDLYIDLLNYIEETSQDIDAAAYRLATLIARNVNIGPSFHGLLTRITEKAIASLTHFLEGLRMISVNVKIAIENAITISKIEEEVDELYRDLELQLFDKKADDLVYLMLMKDITDRLEDAVDLMKSAADDMRYIAIQRT